MANDSLLFLLNTAVDRKKQPQLYQFLQNLANNQMVTNQSVAVIAGSAPAGGFVTSSIGGTASTIAMFTAIRNIEDVTQAGISSALDLLP